MCRKVAATSPSLVIKAAPCAKAKSTALAAANPIPACGRFTAKPGSAHRGDCSAYGGSADKTQCWVQVSYTPPSRASEPPLEGWVNIAKTSAVVAEGADPGACGEPQLDPKTGQPAVFAVGCDDARCGDCRAAPGALVPPPPCPVCTACNAKTGRCDAVRPGTSCGDGMVCSSAAQCGVDSKILNQPCQGAAASGKCTTADKCAGPTKKAVAGYCPGPKEVQCCVAAAWPAGAACADPATGAAGACEEVDIAAPRCRTAGHTPAPYLCPLASKYTCCLPPKPAAAGACRGDGDCGACQKCSRARCVADAKKTGVHCGGGGGAPAMCAAGVCKPADSSSSPPPCPSGWRRSAKDPAGQCFRADKGEAAWLVNGVLEPAAFNASAARADWRTDPESARWLLLNYVLSTVALREYLRDYTRAPSLTKPTSDWEKSVAELGVTFARDFRSSATSVCVAAPNAPPESRYRMVSAAAADVKGAVLATEGDIFVVFRGSEGATTADHAGVALRVYLAPFDASRSPQASCVVGPSASSRFDNEAGVHAGQYYSVLPAMQDLIYERILAAAEHGANRPKRLWLLGHSLGGAGATLAAAIFQEQMMVRGGSRGAGNGLVLMRGSALQRSRGRARG